MERVARSGEHGSEVRVAEIISWLEKEHPFLDEEDRMILGGIVFQKSSRHVIIPARVKYPDVGDNRHPGELELILCSNTGRTHEEFSGSNFGDLYPPDSTGDLIIAWHAHDSVLRVDDEKIASGETKFTPKRPLDRDQDMPVKLILSPVNTAPQDKTRASRRRGQ